MNLDLEGRVAIVTGANRGIGRAITSALAWEGATVALVGRDLRAVQGAAADTAKATKRPAYAYRADTGEDGDVRNAVSAIVAELGRIDVLVNCAARPAGQGPAPKLDQITNDIFWADINVKILGYLRFVREVAPHMQARHFGRIINIAGLAARQTGSIVGSIRNVGVAALTKNLADELGPYGINVTCVHPGFTRTEKTPDALQYQASAAGKSVEDVEKGWIAATSAKHFVAAEEIAHLVAFLASPKSVAISGDAIAVGGGRYGEIHY